MDVNFLVKIVVPGEPVAQGRVKQRFLNKPIVSKKTGKLIHFIKYDPGKSRNFKEQIKFFANRAYIASPVEDKAINLSVRCFMSIPKSTTKKEKDLIISGKLRPKKRPDLKNIIAGVEDALNKVIWKDDSQIVSFEGSGKWYAVDGNPRTEIYVFLVEG